jgi:hypothetical protein
MRFVLLVHNARQRCTIRAKKNVLRFKCRSQPQRVEISSAAADFIGKNEQLKTGNGQPKNSGLLLPHSRLIRTFTTLLTALREQKPTHADQ